MYYRLFSGKCTKPCTLRRSCLQQTPSLLVPPAPGALTPPAVDSPQHTPCAPVPPAPGALSPPAIDSQQHNLCLHALLCERFGSVKHLPENEDAWKLPKDFHATDKFDRRDMLLSFEEMFEKGVPVSQNIYTHYSRLLDGKRLLMDKGKNYSNFVATKDTYVEVSEDMPLFFII